MNTSDPRQFPFLRVLLAFLAIVAFLTGTIFLIKDVDLGTKSEVPAAAEITEVEKERGVGIITGSLGYPSEFIPENMEVCANEVGSMGAHCSNEHLSDKAFTHGVGYRLTVPAGEYYVYAYLPNQPDQGGQVYKAYYSEFVKCGFDVSCTSHEPIKVIVNQGEVTQGVDPQDWYK